MHYAFAWFAAAVGVTLLIDVVAAQALGVLWRPWYRSFFAVFFFAAMLEVAFVLIGCLGYVFTSMKRRVQTTRNRALLSGASFAAILLPVSGALQYFGPQIAWWYMAPIVALALGVGSSFVSPSSAA